MAITIYTHIHRTILEFLQFAIVKNSNACGNFAISFFFIAKTFFTTIVNFPFLWSASHSQIFFSVSILHLKDLYRFYQTKLFLVVKKGYYCKVSYLNEWIHKQKIVKTGSKRFFYIVSLGCNISRPHIIRAYHSRSKQRVDQRVLVLTLKFLALK